MIAPFEDASDEFSFAFVHREDFFLDRVLRDQAVHGDGASLADAMSAVGRLIFNGRVPPRVEMNDVVSGRQVQSRAAGFQRDQEQIPFAVLKGIDRLLPLLWWR